MRIKTIILPLFMSVIPLVGESQTWSGIGSGVTGIATTSCIVPSDKLYFGAWYGSANFSGTPVNGLCSFLNDQFDTLNQGLFGGVYDVAWYNNKLVAAGQSFCAGIPPDCIPYTENIAAWDSVNGWQTVTPNGGSNGTINCLEIFNNELYAAGQLVNINNTPVSRIAKWNGTSWSGVGGGVTGGMGVINCMAEYHNQLYVGGDFTVVGNNNLTSYYIAKWNGTVWDSVPTGPNWYVVDMVVDSVRDVLYVAGGFTNVDGQTCYGIAQWNDTVWQPVGTGLDTLWGTMCLAIYNGELYAGGANETVSTQGDTIRNIYKFDGTKWTSVDGGTNLAVMDMTIYNGNLYVGGYFSQVGNGIPASRIACYGTTCPTSVGISENPPMIPFRMFPNPNKDILRIETEDPGQLLFRLIDLNGKLIAEKKFTGKLEYNTTSLASGTYMVEVSLIDGQRLHSEKLIIE